MDSGSAPAARPGMTVGESALIPARDVVRPPRPFERRGDDALRRGDDDLAVHALDGLDLADPRQHGARTALEQRAVAALEQGAAGVVVAQLPAFHRRGLVLL